MKRRLPAILLASVCVSAALGWAYLKPAPTGKALTVKAQAYLKTLSEEQRQTSLLPYDTPKRVDWHFIPKKYRKGLQIKDMNETQRAAAHGLLRSALSKVGYDKAVKIMQLEAVLAALEQSRRGGPIRDAERYYYTIFGKPQDKKRWGLSIEGHHLSLNFVIEGDKVISSTPTFLAANPTIVRKEYPGGPPKGARVLEKEETLAFELVNSLDAEQRKTAVLAPKAPREIRAAGEPQPPQTAAEGIAAKALTRDQAKLLRELVDVYASTMPPDVARRRLAAIEKAGFEKVHFAWAGSLKPGVGHYYRIQGPTFLIEFVNTQPDAAGNPASHIHCVWRDMQGDFAVPVKK